MPATVDSSSQASQDVMLRFHEAFNSHDVSRVMALMTADCIFENTYPPPDGQRLEGADAVRGFWIQLFSESPQAVFEVEEAFAIGDRGVLRWRYSWSPAGHIRGIDVFRIRDGLVAEKLSYVKG